MSIKAALAAVDLLYNKKLRCCCDKPIVQQKCLNGQIGTCLLETHWYNFQPCTPPLRATMHSVIHTDRQTDGRTDRRTTRCCQQPIIVTVQQYDRLINRSNGVSALMQIVCVYTNYKNIPNYRPRPTMFYGALGPIVLTQAYFNCFVSYLSDSFVRFTIIPIAPRVCKLSCAWCGCISTAVGDKSYRLTTVTFDVARTCDADEFLIPLKNDASGSWRIKAN